MMSFFGDIKDALTGGGGEFIYFHYIIKYKDTIINFLKHNISRHNELIDFLEELCAIHTVQIMGDKMFLTFNQDGNIFPLIICWVSHKARNYFTAILNVKNVS